MAVDLMKLQNGSDIRGIAMEGVEGEQVNLDEETAGKIGGAFVYWLTQKAGKNPTMLKIAVGHDSRLSSDALKAGLMKGITIFGAEASDAGLASTPAMFMSTIMPYYEFDGAIMITASHLPWNRNGFKFFTPEGGLNREDIVEILRLAERYNFIGEYYEENPVNLMQMYSAHLRQMISMGLKDVPGGLKDMHIVVDAGNGAGGFFARDVLAPLGADISGSQFLDPDGTFPNHQPNPENKAAMDSVCRAVLENKADLGLIFDTDVDRSAAVGPDGKPIARNAIVALAAALAADDYPGGTVVTDSVTSNELHEFLEEKLGLRHLRYKRGYRNVINKARSLNAEGVQAFLAIETSGHAAYSDNYFLDDGAFLAVQIVINAARLKAQGKDITALLEGLGEPAESCEVRFSITEEDFGSTGSRILENMEKWVKETSGLELETPNYEGVRVNFDLGGDRGWFLLRKSLHDPVMPLNVESETRDGVEKAMQLVYGFICEQRGIAIPE